MDHCDECGFVYAEVPQHDIASRLTSLAPAYAERLGSSTDVALRAHPFDGVWSALEYCCHVRDILRVQRERLALALAEDVPEYASMDREERVTRDRYNEDDPARVSAEIAAAAAELVRAFEELAPAQWQRTAIYRWPVRAERTMTWLGRHTLHEGVHHLLDVDRVLAAATAEGA